MKVIFSFLTTHEIQIEHHFRFHRLATLAIAQLSSRGIVVSENERRITSYHGQNLLQTQGKFFRDTVN